MDNHRIIEQIRDGKPEKEPLSVTINNSEDYDRTLVYLLLDELNSFMRMEKSAEGFTEKLNELMEYKLVCIGYKGEAAFYYSQDNVKPGNVSVSLIKASNDVIRDNMNKLSSRSQSTAMNAELDFMDFEKKDAERKAMVLKVQVLTAKVQPVVLPCYAIEAAPARADSLRIMK